MTDTDIQKAARIAARLLDAFDAHTPDPRPRHALEAALMDDDDPEKTERWVAGWTAARCVSGRQRVAREAAARCAAVRVEDSEILNRVLEAKEWLKARANSVELAIIE